MLVALGQQVDIVQHAVAAVVLHLQQARALGLDTHIDIFGHQAHKLIRVFRLQTQGHINNAVVVGLGLGVVQVRHVRVVG